MIFHPLPAIMIVIALIYFFTERTDAVGAFRYADWIVIAILLACYFYAYFDWQTQVYGQKLVDDYKEKIEG